MSSSVKCPLMDSRRPSFKSIVMIVFLSLALLSLHGSVGSSINCASLWIGVDTGLNGVLLGVVAQLLSTVVLIFNATQI